MEFSMSFRDCDFPFKSRQYEKWDDKFLCSKIYLSNKIVAKYRRRDTVGKEKSKNVSSVAFRL